MKISYQSILWLTLIIASQTNTVHATESKEIKKNDDGSGVMSKATQMFYYQGKDQVSTVKMTIVDKQGRQRKRELVMLRRNSDKNNGQQKYYAYFNYPTDIKKMVFMAWKNVQAEDDRWLYLPALDLVKRIAASDVRTSFVGSDFYYEDVSGRSVKLDKHQVVNEDELTVTVKSVPIDTATVEFKYYITKIDKKNNIPMLVEYFNHQDQIYRRYETLGIENINGFETITKNKMVNLLNGNKTTVEYSNIKYSQGVPENVFSERFLRRKPKSYIHKN